MRVFQVATNYGNFEGKTGYQMLQAEYRLPSLDQGFASLIQDLKERGLLDETLVAMYDQLGRPHHVVDGSTVTRLFG